MSFYKLVLKHKSLLVVASVVIGAVGFFLLTPSRAEAAVVTGHFDNRSVIWIDKFELEDSDMGRLNGRIKDTNISKADLQTIINQQLVGKYEDKDIMNYDYRHIKGTCDEGSILDANDEGAMLQGRMWYRRDDMRINMTGGTRDLGCVYLFDQTIARVDVAVGDTNKANIWFNRKDEKTLLRVDGVDGNFSSNDTGNGNIYQTTSSSRRCDGSTFPSITIDDGTKTAEIANGQYETCDNRGKFGVNIDNRGPGGSGGTSAADQQGQQGAGQTPPSCESNNSTIVIGWLVCGVINLLDDFANSASGIINSLLEVNSEDFTNTAELRSVWSVFRAISTFALVGVALVLIIGQAIGGGD